MASKVGISWYTHVEIASFSLKLVILTFLRRNIFCCTKLERISYLCKPTNFCRHCRIQHSGYAPVPNICSRRCQSSSSIASSFLRSSEQVKSLACRNPDVGKSKLEEKLPEKERKRYQSSLTWKLVVLTEIIVDHAWHEIRLAQCGFL